MRKVIVFGSANWDIFFPTSSLPSRDTIKLIDSYESACGGKGANQAVACARAGSSVAFYGAVGNDSFADIIKNKLANENVDTSSVKISQNRKTGLASIFVDHKDGTHRVLLCLGANEEAQQDSIPDHEITPEATIVMQGETPITETEALVKRAKNNGARTILNFAPAAGPISADLLHDLDYLILNEHEADAVAAQHGIPSDSKEACAIKLSQKFNDLNVVITLGPDGAVYAGKDGNYKISSLPIKAIDTIGAGDAFVGYFAAGLDQGLSTEDALRRAAVAGSLACTEIGAQSSVPLPEIVSTRQSEIGISAYAL